VGGGVGLPSILLLLSFGILAGPVLGWIDPDESFGALLLPLASLSVSIILHEGGRTLKIFELPRVGGVVCSDIHSISVVNAENGHRTSPICTRRHPRPLPAEWPPAALAVLANNMHSAAALLLRPMRFDPGSKYLSTATLD